MRYGVLIAGAMLWAGTSALAESLIVRLPGVEVTRIRASFACGAEGVALGLPAGPFTVEYLNAGENHLAVLPVHGKRLIFANVIAASGARYAAGRYIWWDAGGRGVTLYAEGIDGHPKADCHLLKKR
ncbi:MAG: MliC family protein [Edaphobacter sp.]